MNLPKQVAKALIQLVPVALSIWISWLFSPLHLQVAPPKIEFAVRLLSGTFALIAVAFMYLYVNWLRRALLVYRVSKLVRERSDNGLMSFLTPDGTMCTVFTHSDGFNLTLAGGLDSLTYQVSSDMMFSVHQKRDLWLDETNSQFGPALRWLSLESSSYQAVNERKIARKILRILG